MIKKIFILIIVLVIGLFTMTGCSSFDDLGIKNSLNHYFDWFEGILENTPGISNNEDNNNSSDIDNENTSDTDNESNASNGDSITLDKNNIIF